MSDELFADEDLVAIGHPGILSRLIPVLTSLRKPDRKLFCYLNIRTGILDYKPGMLDKGADPIIVKPCACNIVLSRNKDLVNFDSKHADRSRTKGYETLFPLYYNDSGAIYATFAWQNYSNQALVNDFDKVIKLRIQKSEVRAPIHITIQTKYEDKDEMLIDPIMLGLLKGTYVLSYQVPGSMRLDMRVHTDACAGLILFERNSKIPRKYNFAPLERDDAGNIVTEKPLLTGITNIKFDVAIPLELLASEFVIPKTGAEAIVEMFKSENEEPSSSKQRQLSH